MSGGSATLACYRVAISTPSRKAEPVIAAASAAGARERARALGYSMFGRAVFIDAVRLIHPAGVHRVCL